MADEKGKKVIHRGDVVQDHAGNLMTVVGVGPVPAGNGIVKTAKASEVKVIYSPNPHPDTIVWGGVEARGSDGDTIMWGT